MFKEQVNFKTTYSDSQIINWQFERTGLQVVLVKKQTPIVNGYFAVASEIDNDSGAPHTLEHLVFMGSKKYPYKGLLDEVGNQMMSDTNAWTDTDQTVYTLSSAGWEGFSKLLPVYLDHMLYPTLTDDACLTEVYHIDGNGEEKGVVFSEIQGVENTPEQLISLRVRQLMYDEKSAFSSETGGLMDALRVLTNEQIREFHKLRYTPDNICVVVAGDVEPEDLIAVMTKFDDSIEGFERLEKRPFVDSPLDQRLTESKVETIEFPETDEEFADAELAFMGPHVKDVINGTAIDILGSYLTRPGVGKMALKLTEVSDPLATEIDYHAQDFTHTHVMFYVSGIPTARLESVPEELKRVLEEEIEEFDLDFVRDCLERKRQKLILRTEQETEALCETAITNMLYGNRDGSDLKAWLEDLNEFDQLAKWDKDQWVKVLRDWLVDNKSVCVLGKPSEKLYNKLNDDKEARLVEYREKYGKEGLAKLHERLEQAQQANEKPIPQSVFDEFASPDPSRIKFIKSMGADLDGKRDHELQKKINEDKPADSDFQLSMHFENYDSLFVSLQVILSSFQIEERLLPYIEVIILELFGLPMELPDGTKWTYEQVVRQVKQDTVENYVDCGRNFQETVVFGIRAKKENYAKGIEWIRRAMYNSVFDKERIAVLIEKHLNGLAERKRDGSVVMHSSVVRSHFTSRSLSLARDDISTEQFYKDLYERLDEDWDSIVKDLEQIRKQLFTPNNMRVFVHGDVMGLDNPVSAWKPLSQGAKKGDSLTPFPRSLDVRTEQGIHLSKKAVITPLPATESSFLGIYGKSPTDFNDPDLPALELACEYLSRVEGPMWKGVRGNGLAYGCQFGISNDSGHLTLVVYRGADAAQAVTVCGKLIEDLVNGTAALDEDTMEATISSKVHSITTQEINPYLAACTKYVNEVLQERGDDYTQRIMKRLREVTPEEIRAAASKFLKPLFDPSTSSIYVACHPSMVEHLNQEFTASGYTVEVNPLVEVSDSEDDDDESDDEEDDEESDDEE